MRIRRQAGAFLVAIAFVFSSAPDALAVFDDIEFSPRARALGGAYAGLSDDATAIYYNPAGLVNVEEYDLYGSMYELFDQGFLRVNAFGVAIPTSSWGTFGVGYNDFRVEVDDFTLSVERTVKISHGVRLMEDISSSLSFGYSVSIFNLDYPTESISGVDLGSATTFGIDIGVLARLRDRTTAGVFWTNVNNPTLGDPVPTDLPQRISGGIAYRPYDGVVTVGEIEKQLGEEIQFRGGIEFEIAEPIALRFGAQSQPNLFNVGVGFKYRNAKLDLTYTHHPVLDETLQYGLGLRF